MEFDAKQKGSEKRIFSDIVNSYCREFGNWKLYQGIPKYDILVAGYIADTGNTLHLLIDFSSIDSEVYIPLSYFSESGIHSFSFPAFEKILSTKDIFSVDKGRFLELTNLYIAKVRLATDCNQTKYAAVSGNTIKRAAQSQLEWDRYIAIPSDEKAVREFGLAIGINSSLKIIEANNNIYSVESLARIDSDNSFPIISIIKEISGNESVVPELIALRWFNIYLKTCIKPLVILFNNIVSIDIFKGKDTLVELDHRLFPSRLYLKKERAHQVHSEMPERICFWTEQVVINNLCAIISALGRSGIVAEQDLIKMVYDAFKEAEIIDTTGLIKYVLCARHWNITSKWFYISSGNDRDKTSNEYLSCLCKTPNVLHKKFLAPAIIYPSPHTYVFSRYFPKENIVVSIRPFDVEKDLEMAYEWFHREHAKKIWKMDWSLEDLEKYYRCHLGGSHLRSYIGEVDGEPAFNFEVYWAIRDLVGDYYDVLPDDYGTHFMIATTDKRKKYPSACTQAMLDWLFAQPEVGKLLGEGSTESIAALMNKAHAGFRLQKVIEMPHKKANLNFCYREWYWEKFPENRHIYNQFIESNIQQ